MMVHTSSGAGVASASMRGAVSNSGSNGIWDAPESDFGVEFAESLPSLTLRTVSIAVGDVSTASKRSIKPLSTTMIRGELLWT